MKKSTFSLNFQYRMGSRLGFWRWSLLTLAVMLSVFNTKAQVSVIINTGTVGATPAYNAGPIYRSSSSSTFNASRYTYLYTAAELTAAGITNGSLITELGWVKNNNAVANGPAVFNIYMKNTSATAFSLATETWVNLNTGATAVYQNNAFVVPATMTPNYITFPLQSAFVYTGGSLEISTEFDINGVGSPASSGTFDWLWSTVADRIYGTGQSTMSTAGTLSSTTNSISDIDDRRPFIQITYLNTACTTPPVAGSAVTNVSAPVCPNSPVNLSLTGNVLGIGQSFQWEASSALAGPYTPVGSSQASAHYVANPTTTTYYRCVVTCGVSSTSSNPVKVDVSSMFAGGTYTINPSLPISSTNFQTIQAAASAMQCGISGPVVFNVTNADYAGQVVFGNIAGTSAINTITFNGNGAQIMASPTSNDRYMVLLNGTDYLTLNNFRITSTDVNFGVGVYLINGANNNTITNCTIDLSAVTSTSSTNVAGIVASGSLTSFTTAGNNANNCIFSNNIIKGGAYGGAYYGISLLGNTGGLDCQGNQIINNNINNFYATGIYLTNTDGTIVRNNTIHRTQRQSVTTFAGVQFNTGNRNGIVEGNRIYNSHSANTSSTTAYGIFLTACDAPTGMANIIRNNLIYNLNVTAASAVVYGIYNSSSDGMYCYFNTISLDFPSSVSGSFRGFYQLTAAIDIIFRDNLISVTQGGTGAKHALYFGTTTSTIASNNNILYVNAGTGTAFVGFYSTNQATLADWQLVNTNAYDQNSVSADPQFASPQTFSFFPTNAAVNNIGVPISGITTDLVGNVRNVTTPDAGALEFNPTNDDAGIVSITGLSTAACPGSTAVGVSLKNFGLNTLTSATLNWTVNGVAQTPVPFSGSVAPNGNASVALGSFTAVDGVIYKVKAWTSSPNSTSDVNNYNDTSDFVGYETAMSGIYTVGGAGTFSNPVAAVNALVARGICGPVTFNVTNAVYPGILYIPSIVGSSVTNTITFNGNGATLTALNSSSDRAVVRFEGADYVTFDNFKVTSLDVNYGFGFQFMNASNYNTIKNCVIDMSSVTATTSTQSGGIVFSGSTSSNSTAGNTGSFNKIQNNTIQGGPNGGMYYGIVLNGNTGYLDCQSNEIRNNVIKDFYSYGVYMINNNGTIIADNDISRANRISVTTFAGVTFGTTNKNVIVERNRIHNTHDNASSLTGAIYPIYSTSCTAPAAEPNIVRNNLIYNLNGNGGTIYGLYNSTSPGMSYYFNTVSIDHAAATSGTVRGFYQTGTAADIILMNNNISISYGGSGIKHGLYFGTAASTIVSNYNNIILNSAGSGSQSFGFYSVNQATLNDWKLVNGAIYDQNSISVDPAYANLASNDLKPTAASLNNKGLPIAGITTDFDNVTRNVSAPDMGALEFTPILEDGGVSAINGINAPCPGSVNLTATFTNFGVLTINSATIKWTVNGAAQPTATFIGSLASGLNATVSLGSLNMVNGVVYNIKAWSENPNSNPDGKNDNDTTFLVAQTAMGGVYTVGPAGDFPTVAAAADALTARGLCTSVTINVTAGTYSGRVLLNQVAGASSTKTITFNGNGATINHTPDASNYSIVNINGTPYVTFDNFNVTSGSVTYGYGFLLTNGANNTTIKNCNIDLSTVTSTGTTSGGTIVSGSVTSATTTGNNASDCVFQNNTIQGGVSGGTYYGITMIGNTGNVGCRRNTVINNTIRNTYFYNIYMAYTDSTWVANNDISRATKTTFSTFIGIYLVTSNQSALIEKNRVHDSHTANPTSTSAAYPLYVTGSDAPTGLEIYFINNLVYNINGNGTTYGIYNSGSDGVRYWYNTISLDNPGATTSNTVRGFYQTTAATNIRFENNIVSVTQGGSGAKHVLYFATSTSTIISNRNDLYINSTGSGAINLGYYSADVADLTAWQAANAGAYDQNSVSRNPEFLNIAANNYTPNSFYVNNVAAPIPGVTTDFFGTTRNATTPDPGAIEFTPIPTNDGCAQAITVTVGSYLGSTINSTTDVAPTCVVTDAPSGGVWYAYTGTGNFANFSLCGSNYDSRIRIFEGNCSGLICVTGNEDFCSTQSEAGVCSEIGKTYYILVHGNGSAQGNFTLNVTETPVQQGAITSSTTEFCPGDSLMLSAATANGYLWNDAAMSTTQDIYVTSAGSYYTVITDANGCEDTSNVITLTQFVVVPPVVTTTGNLSFCIGDSIELFSSMGNSYLWNDVSMSTTPSIWVSVAGIFEVTVMDTNGCESTSVPVITIENPAPIVNLGADRVTCSRDAITIDAGSGATSYLWSTGATTQSINFQETPGTHVISVIITDANGCEGFDTLEVEVNDCTGIQELGNNYIVNIYPNPGKGIFNIEVDGWIGHTLQMSVSDFRGREVYVGQLINDGNNHQVDLTNLADGVYTMTILGDNQVKTVRLVVR